MLPAIFASKFFPCRNRHVQKQYASFMEKKTECTDYIISVKKHIINVFTEEWGRY
jgi:hypothetical protein